MLNLKVVSKKMPILKLDKSDEKKEIDFELGLKWGEMESWDGTKLHLGYLMKRIHKKEAKRTQEAA